MQNFKTDNRFYIPEGQDVRINGYTKYEQIFCGHHKEAFNPTVPKGSMYISEGFGQLISFTSADLLFGEGNIVIAPIDKESVFLDEFMKEHRDFNTTLFEASLTNSYMGDVIIEMYTKEGKPGYLFHDPRHWTVQLDMNNEIESHTLSFLVKNGDKLYIRQRIHYVGYIENKLFLVEENVFKKDMGITNKQLKQMPFSEIGLDEVPDRQDGLQGKFLVHHVPNMRMLNAIYGMSDYMGKEQLMNALNMLTSFATFILEKHADPAMEVPDGTLDPDSNVYIREQKVFQTNSETKGVPRYITWDGQLQSLFEQRKHVIDMLAMYSEIAPGLLGRSDSGMIPESGRALKIKYARTLQKIARKQRYWKEGILYILQTSQELLGEKPEEFLIEFSDGLPEEAIDDLEQKIAERDLGVTSNETLIEEVGRDKGWGQERIEEEKERLLKEKPTAQGMTTAPAPTLFERKVMPTEINNTTNGKENGTTT